MEFCEPGYVVTLDFCVITPNLLYENFLIASRSIIDSIVLDPNSQWNDISLSVHVARQRHRKLLRGGAALERAGRLLRLALQYPRMLVNSIKLYYPILCYVLATHQIDFSKDMIGINQLITGLIRRLTLYHENIPKSTTSLSPSRNLLLATPLSAKSVPPIPSTSS